MKRWLKVIIISFGLIFIGFIIFFNYPILHLFANKLNSNKINMNTLSVIDDSSQVVASWNSKPFGRVYASFCSPPTDVYPYPCKKNSEDEFFNSLNGWSCMDGGIQFFDAKGNSIARCNAMGSDSLIFCSLAYKQFLFSNADYLSCKY